VRRLRPQVEDGKIWSAPRASSPTSAASPSLSCYLAPELELRVAPPRQSAGSRLRTCAGGRALALPPRPRATAGAAQELATGIGRLLARRRLSPQQGEGRGGGGREGERWRRGVGGLWFGLGGGGCRVGRLGGGRGCASGWFL